MFSTSEVILLQKRICMLYLDLWMYLEIKDMMNVILEWIVEELMLFLPMAPIYFAQGCFSPLFFLFSPGHTCKLLRSIWNSPRHDFVMFKCNKKKNSPCFENNYWRFGREVIIKLGEYFLVYSNYIHLNNSMLIELNRLNSTCCYNQFLDVTTNHCLGM